MTNGTSSAISALFWGHSGDFWDACLIWSVVLAAVAAGAIGVSTVGSIRAHKLEADNARHELDAFKTKTVGDVAEAGRAGIEAGERAGHAQTVADDAQVKLKDAEATIAEATARAAEAGRAAAESNLEAQKLKQQMAWREITPAQAQILIRMLAGLSTKVEISWRMGDAEAEAYGERLEAILKQAGVSVESLGTAGFNTPQGLFLNGHDGPEAHAIVGAFQAAQVPLSIGGQSPTFAIFVGTKPQPR
jgi:hypothetical protein